MSFQEKIKARIKSNSIRLLSQENINLEDFCSNDYIGFAIDKQLHTNNLKSFKEYIKNGSTGSRLISGNSDLAIKLEEYLADFFEAESALLFNSGYDANLGIISSLPQRSDTIIYDERSHGSIRDGIRLSNAKALKFKHNNTIDLEDKLKKSNGEVFVVIESVYSMDGDLAPLEDILNTFEKYDAKLIIDEAHALGVVGDKGKGLSISKDLHQKIFARIYTFGKAMGCHGAVIVGSEELTTYLMNFSRSLIYTTFLPPHSLHMIKNAFDLLILSTERIRVLKHKSRLFDQEMGIKSISDHPIKAIIIPGVENIKKIEKELIKEGFRVKAILKPSAEEGFERLRICIHSYNSEASIIQLAKRINSYQLN